MPRTKNKGGKRPGNPVVIEMSKELRRKMAQHPAGGEIMTSGVKQRGKSSGRGISRNHHGGNGNPKPRRYSRK